MQRIVQNPRRTGLSEACPGWDSNPHEKILTEFQVLCVCLEPQNQLGRITPLSDSLGEENLLRLSGNGRKGHQNE
jgi:hypothetical protein